MAWRLLAVLALVITVSAAARAAVEFGRYHALVIGINDYQHLAKLKTAVNDASAVADLLRQQYDFTVTLLLNPTRARVIQELERLRAALTEQDNLLIYYAGHGVLDEGSETGFWLPIDAHEQSQANWISMPAVTRTVRAMTAKHIMVVADSCYSGTLVRNVNAGLATGSERAVELARLAAKSSRTALVSGGLEPVADGGGDGHSVFARAFLDVLRGNREVIEGNALFLKLRRPVVVNARQTPQYSDIRLAGHQGGDFLFVPRTIVATPSAGTGAAAPAGDAGQQIELAFWQSIQSSEDAADFEEYLRQYPNGHFAGLARNRLKKLQRAKVAAVPVPPVEPKPAPQTEQPGTRMAAVDARGLGRAVRAYLAEFAVADAERLQPPVRFGRVDAEQAGQAARLTISDVVLGERNGERLALGDVEIEVVPGAGGLRHVALGLRDHFDALGRGGQLVCRAEFRDQNWQGNWSAEIAAFVELTVEFADFSWRCGGFEYFSARAVALHMVLKKATDGGWRGSMELVLEGARLRDQDDPIGGLDVAELTLSIDYDNLDVGRRVDAIARSRLAYWPSALPALAIPFDMIALPVAGELWQYATPVSFRLALGGLHLVSDDLTANGDFAVSLAARRDSRTALTLEFGYHHDARLAFDDEPTLPGRISLDLVFAGLPIEMLSPPELFQVIEDPAPLLAASREIVIRSVEASAARGAIRGSGRLRPLPGAVPPVYGEIELETVHLEDMLLDGLAPVVGPEGPAYADAIRATLAALGARDADSQRFTIQIDRDGETYVNRIPIEQIFELFEANLVER